MYSDLEYEQYLLYKLWLSIILDTDYDVSSNEYLSMPEVLEQLKYIIYDLSDMAALNSNIKNNIYEILSKFRYIKDSSYLERVSVINDLILTLNMEDDYLDLDFYVDEINKRANNDIVYGFDGSDITDCISKIHESICFDMYVLSSHSIEVSDEEFEREDLEYLSNNLLYYYSLNAILEEYPNIFRDELFYSRMLKVFDYEKRINETTEFYKENQKLLKRISNNIEKV